MKFACKHKLYHHTVFEFEAKNWWDAEEYFYSIIDSVITTETEDEKVIDEQGKRAAKYKLIDVEYDLQMHKRM